MLFVILLVSIATALYLYFKHTYSRFTRYHVKHATPIPPVGTMWRMICKIDHFADDIVRDYNSFPNERFVGKYEFIRPIVMVRDIELIKRITVKDFEYFVDHRATISEDNDPLFGRNLFALRGQEWKDMRSTLSPAFTGSKMRMMLPFMVEVGDQMTSVLKKEIAASKSKYIDLDARDLCTRHANDVIASCAFGLKVDSHKERENQFYIMGKATSTFNFKQTVLFLIISSFPKIMNKLKVSLFSEETKDFFRTLVMETMQDRETRHILRPDMIHLLMEAKKGKLSHEETAVKDADAGFATVEESSVGKKDISARKWSDMDLIAQAVTFFIAGFETVSSTMAFLLHELAINPEVQDRLYQEIKEVEEKSGGKLDYTAIQEMTYMDMVVSELLRFWPAAIALDRVCSKDYNLGKPNDEATEDYIIRKGEGLQIPLTGIHFDPQYFPNPNKFDPERFSEENKHNIKPFTYMPFGYGPRNCVGSRFALCEVKVMAYQLLSVFEVSPNENTQLKAKLSPSSFQLRIKGGHSLRLRLRKDQGGALNEAQA